PACSWRAGCVATRTSGSAGGPGKRTGSKDRYRAPGPPNYLPVRRSGPKEGVICAWGITETGARALVSVRLGMREAKEDWLELGRDLTSRGLAAPRLVVGDGAPGLISAVEEIWPRADRQHCAVHRLRNL